LHNQTQLGLKPLLAPIQGQKEGYLAVIGLNATSEKIANLEKKCREMQHVLRFMLLIKPPKKMAKPPRILSTPSIAHQKQPTELKSAESEEATHEEKKGAKIGLQDIDEKLKEIFKD